MEPFQLSIASVPDQDIEWLSVNFKMLLPTVPMSMPELLLSVSTPNRFVWLNPSVAKFRR